MTKEIVDIVAAFKEAKKQGHQAALATVVLVEGSSYRRPGARMLVEDNGRLTGAISGGCLEGDALRKAQLAMAQKQNKLVTYNTLDEDDVQFGVQLGCNGIVHILFEPIDCAQANNPMALLEHCVATAGNAVLCTLFSLTNREGLQPGTCFYFNGRDTLCSLAEGAVKNALQIDAGEVLAAKASRIESYNNGELTALVELVPPQVSLVVVGGGNDAVPLVDMAAILGWQTTVADGRPTHVNRQRFPKANRLFAGKPGEVAPQLAIDERTAVVLMTHNYNYDVEMLALLLQKECCYIGTLGPKKRLERMLADLEKTGTTLTKSQHAVLFGPTGLDIGAETAEEIALSVLAEIKAVLSTRPGTFLRDKKGGIHSNATGKPGVVENAL